jgi:hypothetical protein
MRLPPGYPLDLVGDPCVIVAAPRGRFGGGPLHQEHVDPEQIRRAAEAEHGGATGDAGREAGQRRTV